MLALSVVWQLQWAGVSSLEGRHVSLAALLELEQPPCLKVVPVG